MDRMLKVLVVDESNPARQEIVNMLSDSCMIETADNGASALNKFFKFKPNLVTLSLGLQILDGYETLCQILKMDKDAKVIMISAAENYDIIRKCFDRGAYGFLIKPFIKNEFYATIKNVNSYNKKVLFVFVKHMNNVHMLFKNPEGGSVFPSLVNIDVEHPIITPNISSSEIHRIRNVNTVTQREYHIPEYTGIITEILQRNSSFGAIVSWFDVNSLNTVRDKYDTMDKSSECNFESINILHNKLLTNIIQASRTEMCLDQMKYFEQDLVRKYDVLNMTKVRYDIKYDEIVLPMETHLYFNNNMLLNA